MHLQNLITERLDKADERIQRQAMRIRNSVVRLNLFLGRQNRTNSLQIRKLVRKRQQTFSYTFVTHQCINIALKESIDEKLARDLRELFNGHQRQNEEIAELWRKSDRPPGKPLTRMPANCRDLKTMGHALSGIYPVKGDDNIDMVYCNMTSGKILISSKR